MNEKTNEILESKKKLKQRNRILFLLMASLLCIFSVFFPKKISYLLGGSFSYSPTLSYFILFFIALLLLGGGWLNWHQSDEFKRKSLLIFWASVGIAHCFIFFILFMIGNTGEVYNQVRLGGVIPIIAGAVVFLILWLKKGYVV